jgi:hypothetical protein
MWIFLSVTCSSSLSHPASPFEILQQNESFRDPLPLLPHLVCVIPMLLRAIRPTNQLPICGPSPAQIYTLSIGEHHHFIVTGRKLNKISLRVSTTQSAGAGPRPRHFSTPIDFFCFAGARLHGRRGCVTSCFSPAAQFDHLDILLRP